MKNELIVFLIILASVLASSFMLTSYFRFGPLTKDNSEVLAGIAEGYEYRQPGKEHAQFTINLKGDAQRFWYEDFDNKLTRQNYDFASISGSSIEITVLKEQLEKPLVTLTDPTAIVIIKAFDVNGKTIVSFKETAAWEEKNHFYNLIYVLIVCALTLLLIVYRGRIIRSLYEGEKKEAEPEED